MNLLAEFANRDSSACLTSLKCSKGIFVLMFSRLNIFCTVLNPNKIIFIVKARYSLHINCGGQATRIGKTIFEQDTENEGAAKFVPRKAEWGYSSSGEFNPRIPVNNYIAQNTSLLRMNGAELYEDARLAATSLTYYGRCLAKGNYTVTLYFSEIVFVDDDSYASLGRRFFDIYIQVLSAIFPVVINL